MLEWGRSKEKPFLQRRDADEKVRCFSADRRPADGRMRGPSPCSRGAAASGAPDLDTIVQQSVDEAMARYEEEQRAKDAEIEALKEQLAVLTAQAEEGTSEPAPEETTEPPESAPAEGTTPESEPDSQAETPGEPDPEPLPPSDPVSQKSAPSSSGQGFDLKNLYPDFVWEGLEEAEEESYTASQLTEEAEEAIRLANQERENHGLDPLPTDSDLMELAEIRAEEIQESYSHTRPDGTDVGAFRCGENIGRKTSASAQVNSWMNSEGHRTNILLDRYHHIGAACYQAENGNYYWVMVFSLD